MGKKKKEGLNLSPVSTVSEKILLNQIANYMENGSAQAAQAENPSPVYKTRLGFSARAKGLKNLKKSHVHVIKT